MPIWFEPSVAKYVVNCALVLVPLVLNDIKDYLATSWSFT